MNIEKEGELFEQWWEDEGQYHRAGGNDYCKTFAWEAWIFAKAQAVPDGYVVVPKEPTDKTIAHMINTPIEVNLLCDHADIFLSEGETHVAYQAMIEVHRQDGDALCHHQWVDGLDGGTMVCANKCGAWK